MRNYAIVGFVYSHRCPLDCNYCCHPKSIVGRTDLTPELVKPVIIEFSKHPDVVRFAFTGGEPFLFIEEIKQIMKDCRSEGVKQPFHIATSGYWATTEEYTAQILKELKSLGLSAICLTYDYEHARNVSPDSILRIVRYGGDLGLRIEIFGTFWNKGERVEHLLPSLEKTFTRSILAMPVGRAKSRFQGTARYNLPKSDKLSCGSPHVYSLSIYPDGEVYPCCAGGFNRQAKLSCGNAFSDTPMSILTSAFTNFHVRIAKEIGFDRLYDRIAISNPELFMSLTPFEAVDSVCQICEKIHADTNLMEHIRSVYEEMEIEYVLTDLEQWWNKLQSQKEISRPVLADTDLSSDML
jgi:Predicted Fe-S oxidoreductases